MAGYARYRIYTHFFKFQGCSPIVSTQDCVPNLGTYGTRSVLVMSLATNALQARCNIMHFFDLAPTKSIIHQALGWLRRIGQQMVRG